jgi:VanZ family protein
VANKLLLGAALFWTLTIAFLCLVQINDLPNFSSIDVPEKDKYVHFTFHLVFTLLWSSYFWYTQKNIVIKTVFKVFYVSVAYGILIEFLQGAFTATRKADILDVLANTTGATLAVIALLCYKHFSKNKN